MVIYLRKGRLYTEWMNLIVKFALGLLVVPILFLQWLLLGKNFGHGKAVLLVAVMFLFGSAFFFD